MPYIKEEDREHIANGGRPRTAGELNYLLTLCTLDYVEDNGKSYQTYNDILGALEGCKLEMYRRRVAPYEDLKIKENGDV